MSVSSFLKKYDAALLVPALFNAFWFRVMPGWYTLLGNFKLRLFKCRYGKRIRFCGPIIIRAQRVGRIELGENVRFISTHSANMVGLTTPILLESIGDGIITIGDGSGASSVVISARTMVQIGRFVKLGGNVRIYDHDYHSLDAEQRRDRLKDGIACRTAPIVIEDDVFVGTNSIILKGVRIGSRSIIGAGSVVVRDVPADEVWAGNPAKFVRTLGGRCER